MSDARTRSPVGRLLLLGAGILVGAVATAGVVLLISAMIQGDAPTGAMPAPRFVDESAASGLDHVYDGEFQFFVGGGVAVFDCNHDLLPDLYIAGGSEPAGLYVNRSETGGELRFERLRSNVVDLDAVTGAYPIDIDSDGITDLAVLRVGENVMLRGTGRCGFEDATELWDIAPGDDWTAAFSATWERDQALPTLAFGNYLAHDDLTTRDGCADHYLIRPETETSYGEPTPLSPGWCTLSILFSDWSREGERDLRVTNDRHYYTDGHEQMWRVRPGQPPRLYTEDDGWRTMQIWGMGIASHDLTGDGTPEVFLTSQGDNKLQTLVEGSDGPSYEDIALAVGVTAHRPFVGDTNRPSTAWHAEFGDVNNDGFADLFVTKGNVDSMPEFAMDDPNNLLIAQPDGTFVEGAGAADLVDYARSRGAAMVDLNLDGRLDIVVVERRQTVKVWRNIGATGNWLAVDLVQLPPNSDAVGAWVEARIGNHVTSAEVTIGGGHAGGQLVPRHFGLGHADSAEVRVIWPDGETGPWLDVPANSLVRIDRTSPVVSTLFPGRD